MSWSAYADGPGSAAIDAGPAHRPYPSLAIALAAACLLGVAGSGCGRDEPTDAGSTRAPASGRSRLSRSSSVASSVTAGSTDQKPPNGSLRSAITK